MTSAPLPGPGLPQDSVYHDDVVRICRDLIRIDTSNYGDDSGPGERLAAEHVPALASASPHSGTEPSAAKRPDGISRFNLDRS